MAILTGEPAIVSNNGYDHLQFFKNEFSTDDHHVLANLLGKVKLIAYAIGPEKTIKELVPFLSAKQMDAIEENNIFVQTLPSMWIDLAPYVGSLKDCEELLKNMEPLISHHAEPICQVAVRSLKSFMMKSTAEHKNLIIKRLIIPLIDNYFTQATSKIRLLKSAFILFNSFFTHIKSEEIRSQILSKISNLVRPTLPYLRLKIVFCYLDGVCEIIDADEALKFIWPGLKELWNSQNIRPHRTKLLEILLILSQKFDGTENFKGILSMLKEACEDHALITSAKFYNLLVKFLEIYKAKNLISQFEPIYEKFSKSFNNQYKPLAIACIKYFAHSSTEEEFEQKYIKYITRCSHDASPIIKNYLIEALLYITNQFGVDYASSHIRMAIYKIFLQSSLEHRSSLLYNFPELVEIFLIKEPDSPIKKALLLNAEDESWRNRLKFAQSFLPILKKLGQKIVFIHYKYTLRRLLQDKVHAVRHATSLQLAGMAKDMDDEQIKDIFWPFLMEVYNRKDSPIEINEFKQNSKTPSYLIHINILNIIQGSLENFSNDLITHLIFPLLRTTLQHDAANVRIKSVAIIDELTKIKQLNKNLVKASFKKKLEELTQDAADDVRFAAYEALNNFSSPLN